MFRWDSVPRFGGTEVQKVNAVQVHVLCMPGKSGLPHSKVQVCRVDPFDLDPIIAGHAVKDASQTVDIPNVLVLISQRARNVSTVDSVTKGGILPVLPFKVFEVKMVWCLIPVNIFIIIKLVKTWKGYLLNLNEIKREFTCEIAWWQQWFSFHFIMDYSSWRVIAGFLLLILDVFVGFTCNL